MMNLNAEQFEEMLAAYALDVLEPDERAAFEAQLAVEPQYRAQLLAYEEMLAGLATLTPTVEEPVGHRERMLTKLTAAPAPVASPAAAAIEAAPTMAQRAADTLPTTPALTPTLRQAPQPVMMQRIAGWFSLPGRPSFAAAALALVLAIGLIFWNLGLQADVNKYQQQTTSAAAERDALKGQMAQVQQQLDQAKGKVDAAQTQLGQLQAAVDLLGQPNTVVKALPGNNNSAFSQLIANDQQHRAMLFAYHLEPNPKDKTYEFWFIDKGGTQIPAGIFNVDESGKGVLTVQMPGGMSMSDLIEAGVTMEPAGGLPKPTGQMVIAGHL